MALNDIQERLNILGLSGAIVQLEPNGGIDVADLRNMVGWPIWFGYDFTIITITRRICPAGAILVGSPWTILLETGNDISAATEYRIYYRTPAGVTGYVTALRSGTKLYYKIPAASNTMAGAWLFHASAILSGSERSVGNLAIVHVSEAFAPQVKFWPGPGLNTTVGLMSYFHQVVTNTPVQNPVFPWKYRVYADCPYILRLETGHDLASTSLQQIAYRKPDGTEDYVSASRSGTVLSATITGAINDQAGTWRFHPEVQFTDDTSPTRGAVMAVNVREMYT